MAGGGMNSHNHIMLAAWMPGFTGFWPVSNPDAAALVLERLSSNHISLMTSIYVNASVNTIRGLVSSSWRKEADALVLDVTLPVNSEGKICIPLIGVHKSCCKEKRQGNLSE